MVTGAKYQTGDVVGMVTAIDGPPWLVIGVTEWLDGITYRIRSVGEDLEVYAQEITALTQDGIPLNVESFAPGTGIQGVDVGEPDHE